MLRVWRIGKGKWSACARYKAHHCWRAGKNPVVASLTAITALLTWRIRGW